MHINKIFRPSFQLAGRMPRRRKSSGDSNSSVSSSGLQEKPLQRNAANARERTRMRILSKAFTRLKVSGRGQVATRHSRRAGVRPAECWRENRRRAPVPGSLAAHSRPVCRETMSVQTTELVCTMWWLEWRLNVMYDACSFHDTPAHSRGLLSAFEVGDDVYVRCVLITGVDCEQSWKSTMGSHCYPCYPCCHMTPVSSWHHASVTADRYRTSEWCLLLFNCLRAVTLKANCSPSQHVILSEIAVCSLGCKKP